MASVHTILRKKTNKAGLYPIAIRVTQNRKKVIISLGQHIEAKHWDDTKMTVRKSHPNSVRLNSLISAKVSEANDTVLEAIRRFGESFTSADFKSLLKTTSSGSSFYEYAERYLMQLDQAKKYSRFNSERPLLNKIRKLRNGKHFSFDDITATLFWATARTTTVPVKILGMLRHHISPEINALGTVMVILTIATPLLAGYLARRFSRGLKY